MLVDNNFPRRQFCESSMAFLKLEREGPPEPPGPALLPSTACLSPAGAEL